MKMHAKILNYHQVLTRHSKKLIFAKSLNGEIKLFEEDKEKKLTFKELLKLILESNTSWVTLLVSTVVLFGVSFFLPNMLSLVSLSMSSDWPITTRIIVQFTIGAWGATFISSASLVYVWLKIKLGRLKGTDQKKIKGELKLIQNFFLWILGIMTTLSIYVTTWLSGGA